jgi:hypothetical protein
MKNPFKRKLSRDLSKNEELSGTIEKSLDIPEHELLIEAGPAGDFLETDEDLGYC